MKGKYFLIGAFFACVILFGYLKGRPDGLLHIVFCNVGQGDAIYIKFPDGKDGMVDGGPGNKVLPCLGEHMAFWDRQIELVVLTHPHQDHFAGLIEVLKRYEVRTIIVPAIANESNTFKEFASVVQRENAAIRNLYQGDTMKINKINFLSLWPQKKWVAETTHQVLNMDILGVRTSYDDLNDFSQVLLMSYGDFDVLFTGDAEADILEKIKQAGYFKNTSIEVLKVPHQGNKNGLNPDLVSLFRPQLSIIMVGKNSYGHPSDGTINLLKEFGSTVKRTDRDGEVEIVSDGKTWRLE